MPGENGQGEAFPYTILTAEDAKQMIDDGTLVIDVRQPDEWNRGHIPQATLLPLNGIYSFGQDLKELNLPEDQAVIFVCAMGQRSSSAAEIAMVSGLKKVYNLTNGMHAWLARQYPVER